MATYVITEACIGVKDATCVEVCPASCIHTTPDAPQYYIDPDVCIACEQCFFVCPVDAIFLDEDVPEHLTRYLDINADFFRNTKAVAEPVSFEQAMRIIEGVKAYAGSRGWGVSVSVVDPKGDPIFRGQTEGAAPETEQQALDKAYTAANLQTATHQFARAADAPTAIVPEGFDEKRWVTVGGGYCIFEGTEGIGGVGVAGGPTPQQDVACCQAGLEALRAIAGHH